jgi:hypothetical protein
MTERNVAPTTAVNWWLWAVLWLILLVLARIYLAWALDLFGDEAFYRWESLHPAWSYSDLPPATALLIGLGRLAFGESALALRSLFLASGLALPVAVYFLARPVGSHREALVSGALSLLLPATATIGILAVPDALLLTLCTLFLGCLDRATRTGRLRWWVVTGVLGCLGFLIHYRFVFLPFSLGLAFLCYPVLRARLLRPGPWVAALIAALGLLPAVLFNLTNDFQAMGFHFVRRHPWSFHSEGLHYPLQQAAAVSPVLYVFILLALWSSLKQALRGNTSQALLSSVSLFYVVGLSLLAPWVDQTSTTIHWAWFGYIPMLVVLPSLLAAVCRWSPWGRWLVDACLALAAVFVLASLGMMLASLHFDALPRSLQQQVSVKMVGWDRLREEVRQRYVPGETLYFSEYYLAAQFQQPPFLDSGVIVLDQDKIHRDGRARQLFLWGVSEPFAPRDGSSGLILVDYETGGRNEVYRQIDFLCRRFATIETLSEFSWFDGRRQYGLYRGRGATGDSGYRQRVQHGFCAPPVRGRVDNLREFEQPRAGVVSFHGYLLAQPEGIEKALVRIDGRDIGAGYGSKRSDVKRVLGHLVIDPNYPRVGFSGEIDTRLFANGRYEVEFIGITRWGREEVFKRLALEVAN